MPMTRRGRLLAGAAVVAVLVVVGAVINTTNAERAAPGQVKVLRYQDFSGQVGLPELAASLGYLKDVRLRWIGDTISGPQDIQATVTGDVDFGSAFNGSILRLMNAGASITTVIADQGLDPLNGTSFAVPEGSPIHGARDLIGKKVGVNTVGAQNEDVLDMYLERGGLTAAEAKTVQPVVISPVSMEQALRSHQVDVVALSGVPRQKAYAHGGLRELFSDYGLLGTQNADSLVMRDQFIRDNPDTVHTLVSGIARAIEWTKHTPRAEVISRMIAIKRARTPGADVSAIKYWVGFGVAAPGGFVRPEEFSTWRARLERRGLLAPGALDRNEVFTNKFNPYPHGG